MQQKNTFPNSRMNKKLLAALNEADTLIFIGSGISLWSGLPTWPKLISLLGDYVEMHGFNASALRNESEKGDLLQAASYGFDKLTPTRIGEFMRSACMFGKAKPAYVHELIVDLGPRCFVTTNYDDLIEQSLRQWHPSRTVRPPVTNRHLSETAEIIHSRATDFVFKPHGDLSDIESLILTREQYRQLLPQGERHAALDALKTLMVSRPVIYIGYGLRDPDFNYLRDLLANTYKGGIRDHYAIMADISDDEISYWSKNYGIQLISYDTKPHTSGIGRDHGNLLQLLEQLRLKSRQIASSEITKLDDANNVLTLARYTATLARFPSVEPEHQIRVASMTQRFDRIKTSTPFQNFYLDRFLDAGPSRAIIIGLPGAGKTYGLKKSAARLADAFYEKCIFGKLDSDIRLPIYIDLKLYNGSIRELVNRALPEGLAVDELHKNLTLKFFIDSFNEMPREFWENSVYESDLVNFLSEFEQAEIIIGSRTNDGLTKTGLEVYSIEQLDEAVVEVALKELGLAIHGVFKYELLRLLQKPFFFQLLTKGKIKFLEHPHPRDCYSSLFSGTDKSFADRFGHSINLSDILASIGYDAIEKGQEIFSTEKLIKILTSAINFRSVNLEANEIINWLISKDILIPYMGGRLSFVHQSITEYLAATELSRRYLENPKILRRKLSLKRWDQALFLTLSILPEKSAQAFLNDISAADFLLAISASKYIEFDREALVGAILNKIIDDYNEHLAENLGIAHALATQVPLSIHHCDQLWEIGALGGTLGGSAVVQFFMLQGQAEPNKIVNLLCDNHADYNFCSELARGVRDFINFKDIKLIFDAAISLEFKCNELEIDEDTDISGYISAAAELLFNTETPVISNCLFDTNNSHYLESYAVTDIIVHTLYDRHSTADLELAAKMLLAGVSACCTAVYFISHFCRTPNQLDWNNFTIHHVDRIIEIATKPATEHWPVRALWQICKFREDLAQWTLQKSQIGNTFLCAILASCAIGSTAPLLKKLSEFATGSEKITEHDVTLIKQLHVDWSDNADLFISCLKVRDHKFAISIIEDVMSGSNLLPDNIEIGDLYWWLDWLTDCDDFFFRDRLSKLLAKNTSLDVQKSFIDEMNDPRSKYRKILSSTILHELPELTSDEFTTETQRFLIGEARETPASLWGETLLGKVSTEDLVLDMLLPLIEQVNSIERERISRIIIEAGNRHGRRYLLYTLNSV